MDSTDVYYEHTQGSRLLLMSVVFYLPLAAVILIAIAVGEDGGNLVATVLMAVVAITAVLVVFSTLSVEVTPAVVQMSWRFGWPRKAIERADIISHEVVRNPWWYGWGIRLTRHGWMWNIMGTGRHCADVGVRHVIHHRNRRRRGSRRRPRKVIVRGVE